jgi:hypothetical protein
LGKADQVAQRSRVEQTQQTQQARLAFWNVVPQKTPYLSGPRLRKGEDNIAGFALKGHPGPTLSGRGQPVLNGNGRRDGVK